MAKTIKFEADSEYIKDLFMEWVGESISKAEAQKVLSSIKQQVEEDLSTAAFSIIARMAERYNFPNR